jgi:hypothetical protein
VVLEGDSLLSALGGTAPKAEAAPAPESKGAVPADIPAAYVPVLDNMHDILAHHQPDREWQDGEYGVMERWRGSAGPEALSSVGWALLDLNGDGRKELLISPVQVQDGKATGQEIYALYAEKDGKAFLVQEGTTRNCFALMNGGLLKHHGSGGAMMQILGICGLSADGTLVWHDYWFTDSKNEAHEIGYYWNDNGMPDKKASQEIPQAAFEKAEEALVRQNVEAEFTLFKDWRKAASAPSSEPAPGLDSVSAVTLQWAKDVPDAASAERFSASSTEPIVQVAVCAERAVKDIKVLGLEFVDINEDGKVGFKTSELFRRDSLEPGRPLVVAMTFMGTIPQYGISYTDEQGNACRYAITESGKDGSLQLMPF